MFSEVALCLDTRLSVRSFLKISRRFLWIGLVSASVAIALPLLSRAQAVSAQPRSLPKTTVFLADPRLGVAGAYESGGNTLYFEARIPEDSTQMSARLLDAAGKTIAISGHSMDAQWLGNANLDSVSATHSLSVAGALPVALASVLDKTVLSKEIGLLSALATGAANVSPSTEPMTIEANSAEQTSVNEVEREAAKQIYEEKEAANLKPIRDFNGNLSVTFGGTRIQTVVESFPDGESEDNPIGVMGRTEVSAQVLSSKGKPLIRQFGGDSMTDDWNSDAADSLGRADPLEAGIETGRAIRAAALMAGIASIATSDEAAAIGNLAVNLRSEGMFPIPDSEPIANASALPEPSASPEADEDSFAEVESSSSSCGNCFRTSIQVWNKGLAGAAQHSGTVVLHYNNNNPSRFPVLENRTIFCNHGTCPGKNL